MSVARVPSPPLFKTLDVPASDLDTYPDLAHDICVGKHDVIIIRDVFTKQTMQAVLERINRSEHGMIVTPQESPNPRIEQVTVLGIGITPNAIEQSGTPPDRYHASAVHFRDACRRLFSGLEDYDERVEGVFRRISGGRTIEVPTDASGRIYTPATIRKVPPGREINMHVGNYFLTTPAYAHLSKLFAPLDQLSFFVPISPPESGGEIEVYELQWGDPKTPLTRDGHVDGGEVRRRYRYQSFAPGQGDMFLFNGGRFYHRVDYVVGTRPRWTIGGFIAFGVDKPILYYWS